jgi:hypothetical protein
VPWTSKSLRVTCPERCTWLRSSSSKRAGGRGESSGSGAGVGRSVSIDASESDGAWLEGDVRPETRTSAEGRRSSLRSMSEPERGPLKRGSVSTTMSACSMSGSGRGLGECAGPRLGLAGREDGGDGRPSDISDPRREDESGKEPARR